MPLLAALEDGIRLALVPPDHIELLKCHEITALTALQLRLRLLSGHRKLGLALALFGCCCVRLLANPLVYRGSSGGLQVN